MANKKPSPVSCAYLAGYLDAKSSIYIDQIRGSKYPRLKINTSDKISLDSLSKNWGGIVSKTISYGTAVNKRYTWYLLKEETIFVLESALPYLVNKKKIVNAIIKRFA